MTIEWVLVLLLAAVVEEGSACVATKNADRPVVQPPIIQPAIVQPPIVEPPVNPPVVVPPVARDCANCDPLDLTFLLGEAPLRNFQRNEPGVDQDGCVIRTLECAGVENPLETTIVWNRGQHISMGTPQLVRSVIKCSARGQWVLADRDLVVTEVECRAQARPVENDACQQCNPDLIAVNRLQPPFKAIDVIQPGNDPATNCATRTFICNGLQNPGQTRLEWNGNEVQSEDTPEVVRRVVTCNAQGQWILNQDGRTTVVDAVACSATTLDDGGNEACRNCERTLVVVNNEVGYSAMEGGEIEIDPIDGCMTRTFVCNGLQNPRETQLVWNDGAVAASLDTLESVRRTLQCNEGAWILPERNNAAVTKAGCVAKTRDGNQCLACGAGDFEIGEVAPEIGVIALTPDEPQCLIVDFTCRGATPSLEWNNGAVVSTAANPQGEVRRTLSCNPQREWILTENNVNTVITHLKCVA